MHRRQSQLETLLFFLRHGRLPWYGRGRRADDPRELARDVLRHGAREFVAALREAGDRPRLLRRLAGQFDDAWLTDLVRALRPTEPTALARLLDVVQRAKRPGRADDDRIVITATLGPSSARPCRTARRPSGRTWPSHDCNCRSHWSPMRASSNAGRSSLLGTAPAWRRLLDDDRAWLKATLQRLGRSQPLERRLARTLASDLLPEVASLWLATGQTAAVAGWISAAAAQAPPSTAHDHDVRRDLWEAALSHFLSGGGDARFDRRRFARKLLRRVRAPLPPAATDAAAGPTPADDAWLRAGPAWWTLLRDDAGATSRRGRGPPRPPRATPPAASWRATGAATMLLEAACLQGRLQAAPR